MTILNNIETKFFALFESRLEVNEFEEWLYNNEDVVTAELGNDKYLELITINYISKECKHQLDKVLNFDFDKLYSNKLQYKLNYLLASDSLEITNLKSHPPDSMPITFKIGELNFAMDLPSFIDSDKPMENSYSENIFLSKFNNVVSFIKMIIDLLEQRVLKVWHSKSDKVNLRENEGDFVLVIDTTYTVINKLKLKEEIEKPGYNKL